MVDWYHTLGRAAQRQPNFHDKAAPPGSIAIILLLLCNSSDVLTLQLSAEQPGDAVKYLPPFDLIRRSVEISTVRGELRVNLTYDAFIKLLRMMLAGIDVDEAWYLREYEDIARAVKSGVLPSAKQHFIDDGYFEGRLPFAMPVDERWYLEQNPDVAENVRKGVVTSAQQHFAEDGYREGRLPGPV